MDFILGSNKRGDQLLILFAEYVPLIRDTFFQAQPASAHKPRLTPQQSLPTTSVSPEPEASSSTATPSPEQAAAAQPSVTPPESSDSPEN